eukprot:TRINITY_DN1536_c0_g1_i1.p1 TRINITY_DN1536_c0_g1~~TRINITY_DN1536_c0_g1_i1.p1  ORF type:complete len:356 (+),score=123.58 TRINITY_DN1536_c0_g1_i1:120-1187(+)
MAKLSAFVILLGAALAVARPVPGDVAMVCNQTGAWAQSKVDDLTNALNNAPNSNDQFTVLEKALLNNTLGFTGPQTAEVLAAFKFSDDMVSALEHLQPYVLGLTCEEVVNVMDDFSFTGDKLKVLAQLVNLTTDLENNQTIIDAFSFSSDQQSAAQLIAAATPFSCVFGKVTATTVTFIIDVSQNMATQFTANNGDQFTRLSFAQMQVSEVISKQLQYWQSFTVFSFSGSISYWQSNPQPATQDNINSALQWVSKLQVQTDGTNTYEAIYDAFGQRYTDVAFFLSNSLPTCGLYTDPTSIIRMVEETNSVRNPPTPINTIALDSGYNGNDWNIPGFQQFMSDMAAASGGVYRAIQ